LLSKREEVERESAENMVREETETSVEKNMNLAKNKIAEES